MIKSPLLLRCIRKNDQSPKTATFSLFSSNFAFVLCYQECLQLRRYVANCIPAFHHLNIRSTFDTYWTRSPKRRWSDAGRDARKIESYHSPSPAFERFKSEDPFVSTALMGKVKLISNGFVPSCWICRARAKGGALCDSVGVLAG